MKLVYIKWVDATSRVEPWLTNEDLLDWFDRSSGEVESVGWILKENRNFILIASKKDPNYESAGLSLKIPKSLIKIKKILKLY